jgi:ATP-binding cassette, subfamily B, bacterial PglK
VIFSRFLALLQPEERRRLATLVALMFVAGCLEAAGPLMLAMYLNPTPMVQRLLVSVAERMGAAGAISAGARYFPVLIALFYVVKALYVTWLSNLTNRFAFGIQARTGARVLTAYLNMSFGEFRNTPKGTILRDVISETSQITFNFTLPILQLISEGLVLVCLVVAALFISAVATVSLAVMLGGVGLLAYALTRGYFRRFAIRRREAEERRLQVLENSIAGWLNVRFSKASTTESAAYHVHALDGALAEGRQQTLSVVPRQAFEIALVLSLVTTLYLGPWQTGEQAAQIAIALAAVGFRLLPSVTRVGASFQLFRYGSPTMDSVERLLNAPPAVDWTDIGPLVHVKRIELRDIEYRPRPDSPLVLSAQSHVFERGTITGVSAPSGRGKTTMLNILLGLLDPIRGEVLYDGKPVAVLHRDHRVEIGYLSQHPFVADGTVWDNIHLGGKVAATDAEVVALCEQLGLSRLATALRNGENPVLGASGIHLSGGEKQRFALRARARAQA